MHDPDAQLRFILEALETLDIEIRHERCGGGGGGLCTLQGRRMFIVDIDAESVTQTERAIEALATLPACESMFLPPAIRERVDSFGDLRSGR